MYKRIAIITPPKLKAQWESYKDSDNEFILNQNLEFYTYDEATRKTHKQSFLKNADLVIVDESHHFRNPNKRYSNLKEKLGSESHLLLLSATPINNNYLDLAYQLTLNKSSLIINDQELKPIEICKQADKLANENEESILNTDYYKLCNLIFSRSAKEIVSYLKAIGKSLPAKNIQIKNFSSIPSHIDFNINRLLDILGVNDTKDSTKDSIKFCIYDPYKEEYLPQKIIDKLKSNNAENLGAYSTPRGFLCMSLIKALESSIDAFLSILDKIITYHENFLNHTFDDGDEFADDNTFPQRLQNIIENGYKEVLLQAFEKDIEFDLKRLKHIKEKLSNYQSERDFVKSEKFIALKELIASIKQSNKLIIFTESIVTANALTKALKESFLHFNIESITGDTKTKDFNSRRKRFSPKSLHYELKEGEREIDILIATDCLSEGQNLQDCANLLNWDIAFNPVRAIQRIGRIWRIGSKHQINNITHFFPDMRLENYIDLEAKLRYKLDAAGSATMIDNPFFQKQEAKYIKHKKLREQQLDLMKNEITALEDDSQVSFFSPQALLESLENNNITINSQLKDGIFSIAKHDKFAPNTLFALLQDITNNNAKQIESLYPCIYDMSENQLYPSISQKDKSNHLANIIALSSDEKLQDEFTRLEEFTQDYSDLSALKDKFAKLILSLNQSIDEYQATLEKAKKSDGGLSFVEERKFRLIAWLLINPDFTKLKGTK